MTDLTLLYFAAAVMALSGMGALFAGYASFYRAYTKAETRRLNRFASGKELAFRDATDVEWASSSAIAGNAAA